MNQSLSDTHKKEIDISAILNEYVYLDMQKPEYQKSEGTYLKLKDIINGLSGDDDKEKLKIIKEAIEKNPSLGEFELISQSSVDTDIPMTELVACTFRDSNTGSVYVAYRGTGDGKWIDNGDAFTKDSSLMQRRAQEYFDSVVNDKGLKNYDGEIIVTGHSKGGNSAQYVTMASENSELIDKCYSLDGQGFSDPAITKFKEIHKHNYDEQINKMYSINGENDYVHDLGIPIIKDDHTYFIKTTSEDGFVGWHALEGFFDEGEVNWEFTEQGPVGIYAKEISLRMMNLDPEDIEDCAISIMSFLELGEDYKFGTGDREFATPEEFIGFFANGVPLIIDTAVSSDEIKSMVGNYISDYVNQIANSDYGKVKLVAGAAVLAFATPFIITKLVPVAIGAWTCTYIAEKLFDLSDKVKGKVSEFCRSMGESIKNTLNGFANYISSKFSDFQNWIIDGWNSKKGKGFGFFNSRTSIIQISPENLRNHANKMRKYKRDQENYMNKIRRIVNDLDGNWKGDAQKAFVAKFQSMESVYKQFGDVLEQYADLADKAANEMQTVDNNIKRQLQNV